MDYKEIDALENTLIEKKKEFLLENGWKHQKCAPYDYWKKKILGTNFLVVLDGAYEIQKINDKHNIAEFEEEENNL